MRPGAAMAFKLRKEPRCALAYIGDGGTSEGAFYEALNLAGARSLPVVFVIVNNGWAISVPVAAQTATQTLAQKGRGRRHSRGAGGRQRRVRRARDRGPRRLRRARRGGGPTLIEALTYRLSDHTTADDASRYRSGAEVKEAWALEPLIRVREYLLRAGAWSEAKEQALLQECTHQVDAAVNDYLNAARAVDRRHVRHLVRRVAAASARAARGGAQVRHKTQRSLNWRR